MTKLYKIVPSPLHFFLMRFIKVTEEYLHWENSFFESKEHFFDIRSKKKFLWIKESFVNSKKLSLIQRNRFFHIKENFSESTKLSSVQRNFFFDHTSKKCFFDSKKLFSVCVMNSYTYIEKFSAQVYPCMSSFWHNYTEKKVSLIQTNLCIAIRSKE